MGIMTIYRELYVWKHEKAFMWKLEANWKVNVVFKKSIQWTI